MQDVTLQYPDDARAHYQGLKEEDGFFQRRSPEYRMFWEKHLRPLKTSSTVSSDSN
jgi:hypothetical protein